MKIFLRLFNYLRDRYLVWRTGCTYEQTQWLQWLDLRVDEDANTIEGVFKEFEYIIPVDPARFLVDADPFFQRPDEDALQYFYPTRSMEKSCLWIQESVILLDSGYHLIDPSFGTDMVFVATNCPTDAMMITLKWS